MAWARVRVRYVSQVNLRLRVKARVMVRVRSRIRVRAFPAPCAGSSVNPRERIFSVFDPLSTSSGIPSPNLPPVP